MSKNNQYIMLSSTGRDTDSIESARIPRGRTSVDYLIRGSLRRQYENETEPKHEPFDQQVLV